MKSKGEKERYKHLNAEFQTIARRDQKAVFNDQCKDIEENNRMVKTRDLFKKIRDTKGTFYAKMVTVEDRNGRDLTEAEDIEKRWPAQGLSSQTVSCYGRKWGPPLASDQVRNFKGPRINFKTLLHIWELSRGSYRPESLLDSCLLS